VLTPLSPKSISPQKIGNAIWVFTIQQMGLLKIIGVGTGGGEELWALIVFKAGLGPSLLHLVITLPTM